LRLMAWFKIGQWNASLKCGMAMMPMTNLVAHLHSLALGSTKFVMYPRQVPIHCPKKKRHWKIKQSSKCYLCHPTLLINANGGLSLNLTMTN
jgi:hypothetical protein